MNGILLLADLPPEVPPFVAWVIGGLVATVCVLAGLAYKLAMRGLEREVAAAVLATRCADTIETATKAVERVNEFLER